MRLHGRHNLVVGSPPQLHRPRQNRLDESGLCVRLHRLAGKALNLLQAPGLVGRQAGHIERLQNVPDTAILRNLHVGVKCHHIRRAPRRTQAETLLKVLGVCLHILKPVLVKVEHKLHLLVRI